MRSLEEDTELPKLLMEIGYVATGSGRSREAETIFQGLCAWRPKSELPWIGLAIARLNRGKTDEARKILEDEALKRAPDSDLAKCFLGLTLRQAGHRAESFEMLRQVSEHGRDETARVMAENLLGANPT